MSDGIRIQPQPARMPGMDMRGRLIVVRDIARPLRVPRKDACGTCGQPHQVKTYHFQLDGDGTCIVSTTIWDKLQAMYDHGGFEKVNVVSTPPDVHMSLSTISNPLLDFTPLSLKGAANGHH